MSDGQPTAQFDSISVTINPTFRQLFVAALVMVRYQRALIVFHAVFPLAGLFIIIASVCVRGAPLISTIPAGVVGLLFTPLVTAFSLWSARRRNRLAQGPFTYSFDAEGMHTKGTAFDQTIKWPGILRARKSKQFLFIFIAPARAFVIPVASLTEQGVLDPVLALAAQHTDFR